MKTIFNDELLDEYLRTHGAQEDTILGVARERAASEDMPPVPPEVGALLCLLVKISHSRNVLEIGSGAGASGVWIARGLDAGGHLTTVELDPEHRRLANLTYTEAGVKQCITSLEGNALQVLAGMENDSFDYMFIDPAKTEYPEYLREAKRVVRIGGLIVADNVLWSGRVTDPRALDPEDQGIRDFNNSICSDSDLHSVILPIGDGVSVSIILSKNGQPR